MSFRVETRLTRRARLGSARTEGRDITSVAGAVKGGRSPAKRTLYSVRNANTLKGLGLVAAVCGQLPSPSGGEDFPALGGGARGGGARRALREELWRRGGSTRNGVNPYGACRCKGERGGSAAKSILQRRGVSSWTESAGCCPTRCRTSTR